MSEPITGELRKAMNVEREYTMDGDVVVRMYCMGRDEFANLCDSIDSIHANLERENDRLKCELDRVLGELDEMHKTDGISDNSGGFMHNAEHHAWAPESHYVMLPKDADGVPIHVGDVMENIVCPSVHREVTGVGVECFYGWDDGNGRYSQFDANCYRHHHEPTVEDVLRGVVTLCRNTWKEGSAFEFYDVDDMMKSGNIAEYAAKLRLAGDAE